MMMILLLLILLLLLDFQLRISDFCDLPSAVHFLNLVIATIP